MYRHIETYIDIQKAYTNCMSGLYLILRAILVSALKKIHSGELNLHTGYMCIQSSRNNSNGAYFNLTN